MIDTTAPLDFIIGTSVLFGCGMLAPVARGRRGIDAALLLALLGSLYAAAYAIVIAIQLSRLAPDAAVGRELLLSSWLETGVPALRWEARIDRLSAFFIVLIAVFAAVVAIYSFGALKAEHYLKQRRSIAAAFNVLVWSTLMVVVANDVFSLIATLEIMTLVFGYLTLFKHRLYLNEGDHAPDAEARQNARLAPQIYLIISHTSTAFLVVAFILLALNAQSLSFDRLRDVRDTLSPILATAVFMLALVGLGIRAGLTPAHFWVPLVHPASPTTTHAFSLGVAIKVAIYLMIRFFFQFLPPQPLWGYIVLLAGVGTALAGVWYAIASHDLKTALAYHSVENIGIIVAGLGMALLYALPTPSITPEAAYWIATLALVAALYHLLNHAVFKGLLYLCTGAIDNLTGQTVEFEKLGGLIKIYPWTAAGFLVGALAISGFPPLNGFVSEWLTLQTVLYGLEAQSHDRGQVLGVIVLIAGLTLLVASFALTIFCFLKITGITFLGAPRSSEQARAAWSKGDAPLTMRAMMALMATLCLALGLAPGLMIVPLMGVVESILGPERTIHAVAPRPWPPSAWMDLSFQAPPAAPTSVNATTTPAGAPLVLPVFQLLIIFAIFGLVIVALRMLNRRTWLLKPAAPWNSATPYTPERSRPTGASLSFLIRGSIGGDPARRLGEDEPDAMPARLVLSRSDMYPQSVIEIFRATLNRWTTTTLRGSEWFGVRVQNGDLRSYLLYIFIAAAVALIIFLAVGEV